MTTHTPSDVKDAIKTYLLSEFLPGEDASALEDTTPLVSSGILDSVATIKLVTFLDETFGVSLEPHEMPVDYLDTLTEISTLVQTKLDKG